MRRMSRATCATLVFGAIVAASGPGMAATAAPAAAPQVLSVQSSESGRVNLLVRTPELTRVLTASDFAVTPPSATGAVTSSPAQGKDREVTLLVDLGTSPKVAHRMLLALVHYVEKLPPRTRIAVVMPNGLTPLVAPASSDVTRVVAALRTIRLAPQGDPGALVSTALTEFTSTVGRARTLTVAAARDAGLQTALASEKAQLNSRHIELSGGVVAAATLPELKLLAGSSGFAAVTVGHLSAHLEGLRSSLTPVYRLAFRRHPASAQTLQIAIRGAGATSFRLPVWHRGFGASSLSASLLSNGATWVLAVLVALLIGLMVTWDALVAAGRSTLVSGRALNLGVVSLRLVPTIAVLGSAVIIALALRVVAILH